MKLLLTSIAVLFLAIRPAQAAGNQRWSHFLRQPAKVDSTMQRTIHHEDAETVFGGVQGQGRT
jgi:hypothetical protein